jgi:formate--tetrahydrofolate ligase
VIDACRQPSSFHFLYADDALIEDKIEAVARRIYEASDVYYYPDAERQIAQSAANGHGGLPVCMAKDAPLAVGGRSAPQRATSGRPCATCAPTPVPGGSCPCVATSSRCPASGSSPAAHNVDVVETGRTIGLL